MYISIRDTYIMFKNSPNTGEEECICSRCKKKISENEKIFRHAISFGDFRGINKNTKEERKINDIGGGFEFRLCLSCSDEIGVKAESE